MATNITDLVTGTDATGFTVEGNLNVSDYSAGLGTGLSAIGDFNGDGADDFAVSAPGLDLPGRTDSGGVFVIYGGTDLANSIGSDNTFDLSRLVSGDYGDLAGNGFYVQGELEKDILQGTAAGDFDGDGFDDLLLVAPSFIEVYDPILDTTTYDHREGTAYILYGRDDVGAITTPLTDRVDLATIARGDDVTEIEGEADFARLGLSFQGGGDVNGDGLADVTVGTPQANGDVYVDGTLFKVPDTPDVPDLGGIGGIDDFNNPALGGFLGRTYTLFGADQRPGTIRLTEDIVDGDGSQGFVVKGFSEAVTELNGDIRPIFTGGALGLFDSLAFADLDSDGRDELIIGAAFAGELIGYDDGIDDNEYTPGGVFVVRPDPGAGEQAEYDLRDALFLQGEATGELTATGFNVTNLGDVNGDGRDDVGVMAPLADDGGEINTGAFYLLTDLVDEVDPAFAGRRLDIGGVANAKIFGDDEGDAAPTIIDTDPDRAQEAIVTMGVAPLGDVSGDGIDDFAVGFSGADNERGNVFVVEGRVDPDDPAAQDDGLVPFAGLGSFGDAATIGDDRNGLTRLVGASGDLAGAMLDGGRDLDGDGVPDLLVGAPTGLQSDYSFATDGRVYVLSGADLIDEAGGVSRIGDGGGNTLTGTAESDFLDGGGGRDSISGLAASDVILGGAGGDEIFAGAGDDEVEGGLGPDRVFLGLGDDSYADTPQDNPFGRDEVYGGRGADEIRTGGGDDVLFGGAGNDRLFGGGGNDQATGGAGRDLLVGFAGDDVLSGGTWADSLNGGGGSDVLNGGAGPDVLRGQAGVDDVNGGRGADRLFGGSFGDDMSGGGQNDFMQGGAGADRMQGDFGADTMAGGTWADTMGGGAGDDRLFGQRGGDLMFGGGGADLLSGQGGNDTASGGAGGDEIRGGFGDDVLRGNAGRDAIFGGQGADSIGGGTWADVLEGGRGADVLTGGAGPDTFVFTGTFWRDTVTDFAAVADVVRIDEVSNVSAFRAAASDDGSGNLVYDLGDDGRNTITFLGLDEGDLSAANFEFV